MSSPRQTLVPIATRDALPPRLDREADIAIPDRVVMFYRGTSEERGAPVLRRALTADERGALEHRVRELRRTLAPADARATTILDGAVSAMIGGFPAMEARYAGDPGAALGAARAYLFAARDCPPWAVVEACDRVRGGRAGLKPGYCPTEPELAMIARGLVTGYRVALERAEAVLAAKVEPPAQRTERPTAQDVAAILGRPVGDRDQSAKPPPLPRDTGYADRVRADLDARRQRREAQGEEVTS